MVVDKVVPNALVDGGSGLNILPEYTMKRLGLSLTGPSPFIINMANQSPAVPLGMIKNCRISIEGMEYVVTFHVIKMHSNKDTFPILLDKPWLRMADAIVDWGGAKPSITYGHKDNRVMVSIGSLDGWVKKEIATSSDEEKEDKEEDGKNETLVGVVQSGRQDTKTYIRLGHLGPSFYHWNDNGEYAQWLKDYSESVCDEMMISHHECLKDDKNRSNTEDYVLLEPCEVLTEEEWLQGGLTPWIDGIEEGDVNVVHVDGYKSLTEVRLSINWEGWLFISFFDEDGYCRGLHDQDWRHNPLDSPVKTLQLGEDKAFYTHLEIIYNKYTFDGHGLKLKDVQHKVWHN